MGNGKAAMDAFEFGPQTFSEAWEDESGHRFALELTLMGPLPETGRIECVGFTLRSIPGVEMPDPGEDPVATNAPAARVLASHLRELRLDEKVGKIKRDLARTFQAAANAQLEAWERADDRSGRLARESRRVLAQAARAAAPKVRTRPKRARVTVDDTLLRDVARVYRAAAGISTGQAVAKHFGRPQSTTDKWIGRARRRGLLGPEGLPTPEG